MPAASGGDSQFEERTESATQYRREEFRRQGIVAVSRELLGASVLFATVAAVIGFSPHFLNEFGNIFHRCFSYGLWREMNTSQWTSLIQFLCWRWVAMAGPLLVVCMVAATIASLVQVGWTVSTEPLVPNWDRLNPTAGLSRIFSGKGGIEAVKAFLKLILIGMVAWFFLKGEIARFSNYFEMDWNQSFPLSLQLVAKFLMVIITYFFMFGAADYGYQRYQHEKQMRMTRREARDEFKLREGDPLIKARIKSIQRKMASRRMMEEVPKADVVVTNPTHFAVALVYDPKQMHAPKVVAKGAGAIALKIKEIARFHQVPCVENKPLARALFKELELNEFIPRHLFKAVAEVLAYVYRLKGKLAHG